MISFASKKQDFALMAEIASRAETVARKLGVDYRYQTALMDLTPAIPTACRSGSLSF